MSCVLSATDMGNLSLRISSSLRASLRLQGLTPCMGHRLSCHRLPITTVTS